MAKRFSDTDKWKKPFIRSLEAPYKLLWFYILDDCDHAGIWHVDFDVVTIRIGIDVNANDAIKVFGDKIKVLDNGNKWFIKDFIDFQYGTELNPKNKVHASAIDILKKNNVYDFKGLPSPLDEAKDKDKYKDKDKDKDKDSDIITYGTTSDKYFIINPLDINQTKYRVNDNGLKEFIDARLMGAGFKKDFLIDMFWEQWNGKMFNDVRHLNNVITNINNPKKHG